MAACTCTGFRNDSYDAEMTTLRAETFHDNEHKLDMDISIDEVEPLHRDLGGYW